MITSSDVTREQAFRTPRAARKRRPPAPLERLDFVEGLRGLAALYVVLGHFVSMVDPRFIAGARPASPAWMRVLMAPFIHGHLAVAAFIVISGFCLQYALFRSSEGRMKRPRRFFLRRARRILPAYYAALGLSILVTWLVTSRYAGTMPFDAYLPLTPESVAVHVLLIHNFDPGWMYKINGVLWSIAIEAQLYLVFPLLAWMFWHWGRKATLLITTGIAIGLLLFVPGAGKLYFWFGPLFALGMASAHLAFRPNLRDGIIPKSARKLALVLIGLTLLGIPLHAPLALSDALFGTAVAAGLYAMTVSPGGWGERRLSLPILSGLGAFSYSLYLVHSPIQQILWALRPGFANSGPVGSMVYLLVIGLPIILGFAWLFSLAFERPFMRRSGGRDHGPDPSLGLVALPLRTAGKVRGPN